jgi:DNA-binding winged helix-turn-helix (wHTH) protein
MESRSAPGAEAGGAAEQAPCLVYDTAEARLLLVLNGEPRDISIRAQAHRLVRHMAERNAAAKGAAVLCTHDELMGAVWGAEPMHSRMELAKLVWEVRKKLEPFGAEHLLENERRAGYRLHTCPSPPIRATEERADGPGAVGVIADRTRRRAAIAAAVVVAAGAVAVGAVLATRNSDGGASQRQLRAFVDRIENVLLQSASGREEIANTLSSTFTCSISPVEAGRRIGSVASNRQSILDQLAAFDTPTDSTANVLALLQRSLQDSIEADRHYRDGFAVARRPATSCTIPSNHGLKLAAAADARASAAKRKFVRAFDPLAQRFGRRVWLATEF